MENQEKTNTDTDRTCKLLKPRSEHNQLFTMLPLHSKFGQQVLLKTNKSREQPPDRMTGQQLLHSDQCFIYSSGRKKEEHNWVNTCLCFWHYRHIHLKLQGCSWTSECQIQRLIWASPVQWFSIKRKEKGTQDRTLWNSWTDTTLSRHLLDLNNVRQ